MIFYIKKIIPEYLKKKIRYKIKKPFTMFKNIQLDENKKIIDLGANEGVISEFFLSKKCKVFAFEPNKKLNKKLKELKKKNKNFEFFNYAISNKKSQNKKLYLHKDNNIHTQAASLIKQKKNLGKNFYKVSTITLNDVFKITGKVTLIKIDIEGGEYLIYKDLIKFSNFYDYCFIETHHKKINKEYEKKHRDMVSMIKKNNLQKKINLEYI